MNFETFRQEQERKRQLEDAREAQDLQILFDTERADIAHTMLKKAIPNIEEATSKEDVRNIMLTIRQKLHDLYEHAEESSREHDRSRVLMQVAYLTSDGIRWIQKKNT